MKQKIVVKVQMNCEKCRTKALKIAAVVKGVSTVSIEVEKEHVVVIGDRVDAVDLAKSLKKKFGFATIISVEEVGKPEEVEKPKEVEKPEEQPAEPIQWPSSYIHCPQYPAVLYYYDGFYRW
ncbi:heavy metal-associated isoprenylated plant protein 47-like isoform X1 [Pyrus x bretschneideri]|uniref:heavy metal-associated isoprenylated plant protein 47-like isoform X1 n=2 Tax=Pyrus x bretschneideri TaxID=225117 RepID=UPI002030AF48|nr:heavy metal-associated isoprenylated plant protein 47-like isoform X1 [Pyrus x bretschneideri]